MDNLIVRLRTFIQIHIFINKIKEVELRYLSHLGNNIMRIWYYIFFIILRFMCIPYFFTQVSKFFINTSKLIENYLYA